MLMAQILVSKTILQHKEPELLGEVTSSKAGAGNVQDELGNIWEGQQVRNYSQWRIDRWKIHGRASPAGIPDDQSWNSLNNSMKDDCNNPQNKYLWGHTDINKWTNKWEKEQYFLMEDFINNCIYIY